MRSGFFKVSIVAVLFLCVNNFAQERDGRFGSDPDFQSAKLISASNVNLPVEANETGIGGTVNIRVNIDELGNVTAIESVSGPGPVCKSVTRADVTAIRKAAEDAAMVAKFTPATRQGIPEKSMTSISFEFIAKTRKEDLSFSPEETKYFSVAPNNESSGKSGGALNYKAIALPKPIYPAAARAIRASGTVTIEVLIAEDGSMFSAETVSGHPLLRAVSKLAACEARFTPTLLEGQPVKVTGIITYNFVP